jgi:hypothetical protein
MSIGTLLLVILVLTLVAGRRRGRTAAAGAITRPAVRVC